jgi:zinc transport system ATP-binding protein
MKTEPDRNSSAAIEIDDLWVSIYGRDVLKEVSISLERGAFLGIVGPNGGGKTTLLRVMLGFVRPSRGSVRILGREPRETLRSGWKVGYLPQGFHQDVNFPASALDVVMMGRYGRLGLFRRVGEKDREAAYHALELVGMKEAAPRSFGRLSGGEQQRVSIARALAGKPELLILDEPSTGVDMVAQEDFYELLKDLQERLELTIVMVSHDVGVISTMVSEVACLNCTLSFHERAKELEKTNHLGKLYGHQVSMLVHGKSCKDCSGEEDG